jgi:hypothetical protein
MRCRADFAIFAKDRTVDLTIGCQNFALSHKIGFGERFTSTRTGCQGRNDDYIPRLVNRWRRISVSANAKQQRAHCLDVAGDKLEYLFVDFYVRDSMDVITYFGPPVWYE